MREPHGVGGVRFLPVQDLDDEVLAQAQQPVRTKVQREACSRGFLEEHEADQMLAWAHGSGFSPNASVLIPAPDRGALECVIRFGCLVPNAPLRTPLALWAQAYSALPQGRANLDGHAFTPLTPAPSAGNPCPATILPTATSPTPAQWRWAALMARVFECLSLPCLRCAATMQIIAFITDPIPVTAIFSHPNLPASVLPISPARAPPDPADSPTAPAPLTNPQTPWDHNAQPAPPFQFDQRISW